jgi:predicted helicase
VEAEYQLNQPIQIIVGNPPYSVGQKSENDNNKNESCPMLDGSIKQTYATKSNAKSKRNLYDSYVRAIRWASDHIPNRGIIAFITNNSFIDNKSMDGLRKCLIEEFDYLHVFNLRGAIRGKSLELIKEEGENIFNIMTGVAIFLLVRQKSKSASPGKLHYYDIGASLNRGEKLAKINDLDSIANIPWTTLIPNAAGDWINQRTEGFEKFIPMEGKIFDIHFCGLRTSRDAWMYNSNRMEVEHNMRRMIDAFNDNSKRYADQCRDLPKSCWPKMENIINNNPKQINWSRKLKENLGRGRTYFFNVEAFRHSMYRPFTKQWLYFDPPFIERSFKQPFLFPTPEHKNIALICPYGSARRKFSTLATCTIPDSDNIEHGQCFPLYWYEKQNVNNFVQGEFFNESNPVNNDYVRHDCITDWALNTFRKRYENSAISKEDIFWYIYGILHSREYKTRFANDLGKMSPRIPFAEDFWAFGRAGRALGKLHLEYEAVASYPLTEETKGPENWRVTKMAFRKPGKERDKTAIVCNSYLVLSGIPPKAYEYVVNGRSAIEWIMDRYQIRTDKASGIRNDPNDWSDNPRYIVNLLKSIVTVSMESIAIIEGLPPLNLNPK